MGDIHLFLFLPVLLFCIALKLKTYSHTTVQYDWFEAALEKQLSSAEA